MKLMLPGSWEVRDLPVRNDSRNLKWLCYTSALFLYMRRMLHCLSHKTNGLRLCADKGCTLHCNVPEKWLREALLLISMILISRCASWIEKEEVMTAWVAANLVRVSVMIKISNRSKRLGILRQRFFSLTLTAIHTTTVVSLEELVLEELVLGLADLRRLYKLHISVRWR